jgi:hypothetical protein
MIVDGPVKSPITVAPANLAMDQTREQGSIIFYN